VGEVEIALHQYTEILPVEGVTARGCPAARAAEGEHLHGGGGRAPRLRPPRRPALLDFLASAEGRQPFLARGFSVP
jgi:hypothetical protein